MEVPSAALGVVAIEGNGGTGSAGRATQFGNLGYGTVLFIDSDDEAANTLAEGVAAAGGAVVQWEGEHSIETAVCAELSEAGLTAFIQTAVQVADDPESAQTVYSAALVANGAPDESTGADPMDVGTWATAGVDLTQARGIVGMTAKGRNKDKDKDKDKGWFKRVDKGRGLGRFILDTDELQTGDVNQKINALKAAIYARPEPTKEDPVSALVEEAGQAAESGAAEESPGA